jgi:hypothetical protein
MEPSYYFIANIDAQNLQKQTLGGVVAREVETVFALSPSANFLAFEEKGLLESR